MLGIFRDPWLEDRETRQREQRAKLLGGIGLIGALFTGAFLICSQLGETMAAVGVGGLILMASASAGAGLGFLFSVPRVLSVGPAGLSGARAVVPSRLLGSNTNLERLSEWLTTMIVGVGLSQMTSVGEGLGSFTRFLAIWGQSKPLAAAGPFILIVGLHVEKMMTYVGDEENSVDTAEIRTIAQQLAESTKSSHMRAIADTDRLTFEQTMQVLSGLLYEKDGYRQVLRIGEKLRDTHAAEMASYWFTMAAANGQYYSSLEDADPDEQRPSIRQAVLDASRRAVAHEPQYKRYLAELTRKHGKDNDLQDFVADKEFLRIVR